MKLSEVFSTDELKDLANKKKKPERPWLFHGFTDKDEKAFGAVSSRWSGDMIPAAAYLLNYWIKTPDGTSWLLREGSVDEKDIGNCPQVFDLSFRNVKTAVVKRANAEYDGHIEMAMRQTIRDTLTILGLTELY